MACPFAWLPLCVSVFRMSRDLMGLDILSDHNSRGFRVSYRRFYNGVNHEGSCMIRFGEFVSGVTSKIYNCAVAKIAGC